MTNSTEELKNSNDLIERQAVLALPRNRTRNMRGEIVEETINVAYVEQLPSAQPLVIHCTDCEDWHERQSILGFAISELPSAQPDIIACADCKHWICHDRRCGYWNHGVKPLEWCCHAERRTDGSD